MPKGNMLLGYDENGHCPMLIDDKCSIYEHRPITCRSYDCRIFPAAGIVAGDDDISSDYSANTALEVQLSHQTRPRPACSGPSRRKVLTGAR